MVEETMYEGFIEPTDDELSCEDKHSITEEQLNIVNMIPNDEDVDMKLDDSFKSYLKEISKYPLLTKEEEIALAKEIEEGGEKAKLAKEKLTLSNLKLVVYLARKMDNRGLPMMDLIQEGNIGLMKAIDRFDYRRGFKFSTYATWWINQAMFRGLADKGRIIRLPVHVGEQVSKLNKAQKFLSKALHRTPTSAEIAEYMGTTEKKVEELLKAAEAPVSLEAPRGEEGDTSLKDLIEDESLKGPHEQVEKNIIIDEVNRALSILSDREALIIRLRYGLESESREGQTLDQIGNELGITRERVRQIEKRALNKLRMIKSSILRELLSA